MDDEMVKRIDSVLVLSCDLVAMHKLEGIQRAATKLVPSLMQLLYNKRLDEMKLITLEERRER